MDFLVFSIFLVVYVGLAVGRLPGLALAWAVIAALYQGAWEKEWSVKPLLFPSFNRWQTTKGLGVIAVLMLAFLASPWPREISALVAAGLLLCSRRMRSHEMLGLVDWQLLLLFTALFTLNSAMKSSGNLDLISSLLRNTPVSLEHPGWLFLVCVPLSNLVSNVPAVMMLLPYATQPLAGTALALSSTLAGNLLIVGSIANIIVVEQAGRLGVTVTWGEHAKVGVPVTLASLAVTALWLWGLA
ncbi:MAG: SLC13 family permease [Thermodesulfobacteriota bacterium]